jgi:hypothetical protein
VPAAKTEPCRKKTAIKPATRYLKPFLIWKILLYSLCFGKRVQMKCYNLMTIG